MTGGGRERGSRGERSKRKYSKVSFKWSKSLARKQQDSFLSKPVKRLFEKLVQKLMKTWTGGLHIS